MDWENVSVKLKSLSRRAGLARVPLPVLACIVVACIVLVVLALVRFVPTETSASQDFEAPAQAEEQAASEQDSDVRQVGVDVEGAVASPGLYLVSADARVNDAVAAAGGMTSDADRQRVNLAQKVEDGMQVYVPSREEAPAATGTTTTGAGQASSSGASKGKVNLNTASAEELQTLSGIGPSLSQRIIDYRQANGPFKSVDDLRKVSGIGDTRFKNLKDLVCV
ncbi:MAG: helix-hairpin-helix domain-containing protein [Coriobacteriales bacterium]|nr:helix-hairpin-helix domain-containing protein [Coriobacteriaceae bacterium]MDY2722836.1 helix-hairpin-helix domain-containing protein [Coriobacteriales bacterium]